MKRNASKSSPQTVQTACVIALLAASLGGCSKPPDVTTYAEQLVAGLSEACPMAAPGDVAAHNSCRKNIGKTAAAGMRDYALLWGGEQPGVPMKQKNTTVFRGDLFQDLYLSLYMFSGKYAVSEEPDGTRVIAVQAYFRNALPPGHYPYPFWHSDKKWDAYEKSNEVRFHVAGDGRIRFAGRSAGGSEQERGPYAHVQPPAFAGQWMWADDKGALQPAVSLFSENYSPDNPHLVALDAAYRKMALTLRDADCIGCHAPDGHKHMRTLTLLQTPLHAATSIGEVLREVRENKMPVDDYNDPKRLNSDLKRELLTNGDAFQTLLKNADAWERSHSRVRAGHVAAN